ncbi:MAG TPA: sulfur carrier protein ThiS [Desulfuromonadales bacterium]|nr:sulfur carrier protein ThiS [Desulfuromonadales bacterium]
MTITLNGKPREIADGMTVAGLLQELRIEQKQVVVERNAAILPKQRYAEETLAEGDILEIVHFVGGG